MSRRKPNNHTIVKGALKTMPPRQPSHTASKLGRTYLAKPPEEGWPGGDPEKNGYKPSSGK